jgi:hypothetical protein
MFESGANQLIGTEKQMEERMMSETDQSPHGGFYFHLKKEASADTRKTTTTTGTLYLTLCGRWVYDSIASDIDCPDRWVTCAKCADSDPSKDHQRSAAPTFRQR